MRRFTRKAIIEAPGTQNGNTTGNLHYDATNGVYYICNDSAATPVVNLLPAWRAKKIKAVAYQAAVVEVPKVHIIGRVEETIVGGTRYSFLLGSDIENQEGAVKGMKKYGYLAPTPTTAPNSAALAQVYTALASKINDDTASNYITAKLLTKITFEAVAAITSGMVVGEYIFQGASLGTNETWKGRIAFVDPTWSATTGQVVWVYDEVGTYTVTNSAVLKKGTTTGTAISSASGAASTRVAAQALGTIDNAGYYPGNPNSRRGEAALFIATGFTSAVSEVSRTAVYSKGVGSDMLRRVPIFNFATQELAGNAAGSSEGDAGFLLNALPVSGSYYYQILVDVETDPSDNVLTGYAQKEITQYEIWVKQDSATSVGTNPAALKDALVALL
jgi:hypothetical protein